MKENIDNIKKEAESYNLVNNWKIFFKDGEPTSWLEVLKFKDEKGLSKISGRTWIKHDVLILSTYKVLDWQKGTLKNWKEHLKSLPIWDKTKFFIKMVDVGGSPLVYCDTGKIVKGKLAKEIISKLEG